ncbi:MAG: hypothetical protein QN194_15570, partial [Armatimonadota bacterium]|nr:hypothetical protein [Armatimonadota bacterium]
DSTLSALFHLLEIRRSSLTSTTPEPLLQLTGTTVTLGGFDPVAGASTSGRLLSLVGSATTPALLTLQGPLLQATDTSITTTENLIGVFTGARLSSTSPDPLLSFVRSILSGGSTTAPVRSAHVVHVRGFTATGSVPTPVELAGPLFEAVESTLTPAGNLLRLSAGGGLSSTAATPLVTFLNSRWEASQPGAVTGSALLRMFSETGQAGSTLTLAGPYLDARGSTFISNDAPTFNIADGAVIASTGAQPFATFAGSSVISASNVFFLGANTSFTVPGQPTTVGSGVPPQVTLQGPLVAATDSTFTTLGTASLLFLSNGATLVQTSPAPLLSLTGSIPDALLVNAGGNLLTLSASPGLPAPLLQLGGPLLEARNTLLRTGDPLRNTFSTLFIGDGSRLESRGPAPLLAFDAVTLDTAGNVLTLRRSASTAPSRLELAGPLLVATASAFDTTSLGFEAATAAACCSGFFIGQGAQLAATTPAPLIQLTRSTFNAGPDSQSGGSFFTVADTFTGAPAGELVAPAEARLQGPLLRATDSTLSALFHLLEIRRSSLTSTTPEPLLQLTGTTVTLGGLRTDPLGPVGTPAFGTLLTVVSSSNSGTPGSPASVSLAGPLLSATNSSIATSGDVIRILNGAELVSTSRDPFIQLTASPLTAGFVGGAPTFGLAGLFESSGTGGASGTAFATSRLQGPLLASVDSNLTLRGGLVEVFPGGVLEVAAGDSPFVTLQGGNHAIATDPGAAIFRLFGRPEAVTSETINLPEFGTSMTLQLGTDRPVRAPDRVLLETSSEATINARSAMRIDRALLEATLPLIRLRQDSRLTVSTDALDLSFQAKVTSLGPLFSLDGSVLTVQNGALVRVAGGSFLNVTGDLVVLSNGSILNLGAGPVLSVLDNSLARITGGLVAFGGTGGNQVNVTNTACQGATCLTFGSGNGVVRVAVTGGATAGNVSIQGSVVKNPSLGLINYASPDAAAIVVSGPQSRVVIQGQ